MSVAPDKAVRPGRLTADEYLRAADAGAFGHQANRAELIGGRVYFMAAQGVQHAVAMSRIARVFVRLVPSPTEWFVAQGTYILDEYDAPDPDALWLPAAEGTPYKQWPLPLLLIEVSYTTYRRDSGRKLRLYARRGVTDYWIFNLKAARIEVYRRPLNPTGKLVDCHYAECVHYARGQTITLLNRPDVTVNVDDLLPA